MKIPEDTSNHPRRRMLRSGLLGGIALIHGAYFNRDALGAAKSTLDEDKLNISVLASALRATGKAVCISEADNLESTQALNGSFDLHLRRAGLSAQDAQNIAQAMRTASSESGQVLRSFSMSYNPGLGDTGAVALALALPSTVAEVGLVQCAIGDEGGEALLNWASAATKLRMVCVEENRFSQKVRYRFSVLGQQNEKLIVVV